jgi:hypothetical protein
LPQPQPHVQVLPGQASPQLQMMVFDEAPQVHLFVGSIVLFFIFCLN